MRAKMEVNVVLLQFIHVSWQNGARSKKRTKKFRQKCFASLVLDLKKNAILAVNVGCFNLYFLCKWRFANLITHFSFDFEQQQKNLQEAEYTTLWSAHIRWGKEKH